MAFTYDTDFLFRHLDANPYNLQLVAGYPQLDNHWATAAQFQREGFNAASDAECPYNDGTSAALHWNVGRTIGEEETPYGDELCRNGIPIDDCTCC